MSISINTSAASLSIMRELSDSQTRMSSSMKRLSTGLRINNGSDDAAGMTVSQNLLNQVSSNRTALGNINDGLSLISITESSLGEISEILLRLRNLSLQSANGSMSATDRIALNIEFEEMSNSTNGAIKGILESALFNEARLIDNGIPAPSTLQIGWQSTDQYNITAKDYSGFITTLDSLDISTDTAALNAIGNPGGIDAFIDEINRYRAELGSDQNTLDSIKTNLETNIDKTAIARGRIIDADYAREATALAREQMKQEIGVSILRQVQDSLGLVLQLIK